MGVDDAKASALSHGNGEIPDRLANKCNRRSFRRQMIS